MSEAMIVTVALHVKFLRFPFWSACVFVVSPMPCVSEMDVTLLTDTICCTTALVFGQNICLRCCPLGTARRVSRTTSVDTAMTSKTGSAPAPKKIAKQQRKGQRQQAHWARKGQFIRKHLRVLARSEPILLEALPKRKHLQQKYPQCD